MAITFLGYLDAPEELLNGKRRCLFGCDGAGDVANLPTTEGLTLPGGGKTAKPAPWSKAMVANGGELILRADGTWDSAPDGDGQHFILSPDELAALPQVEDEQALDIVTKQVYIYKDGYWRVYGTNQVYTTA